MRAQALVRCALGVFGAAVAWLGAAGPAHADDPGATSRTALAEALFREGHELLERGELTAACAKLAESERLEPAGGTVLNLALCHERQGKTATAWVEYKRALAIARRERHATRERFALEHLAGIEPRLARLVLVVDTRDRPLGLAIAVDDVPLAEIAWGTELPLDPGEHRVSASAPEREPFVMGLHIDGEGGIRRLPVPSLARVGDAPDPAHSHAWQLGLGARIDLDGRLRGAVGAFSASIGLGDWIELSAAALVGRARGFEPMLTAFFAHHVVKPLALLAAPLFVAEGVRAGVRFGAGLAWDPFPFFGFAASASVAYFPSVPEGYEHFVFVPSLAAQARLP